MSLLGVWDGTYKLNLLQRMFELEREHDHLHNKWLYIGRCGCLVAPGTLLEPDALIMTRARAGKIRPSYIPATPEIPIEFVKSYTPRPSITTKIDLYFAGGAEYVWAIYPDAKRIFVHSRRGMDVLDEEDVLTMGDLLPEYQMPVEDVFKLD